MPIHKTIMPDGSIGYKYGTTGKPYKRLQDARRQQKAIHASGYRQKKDQKVKEVCPQCGKQKCQCKKDSKEESKKASYTELQQLRKQAAMTELKFQAIDKGPQYQFDPQELFRIQHLRKLVGPGALTTQNRMGYSKWAPTLLATVLGAGIGALYGHGSSQEADKGPDTMKGTAYGAGIGLLTALAARGVGNLMGNLQDMTPQEMSNKVNDMGAMDWITRPYTSAYMEAQLDKDFDEWSAVQRNKQKAGKR